MATDAECSTPARKGPAVRSHSEAERKRRQRINAHLATLRTIVPSASRMDKAALLAEVVRELRAKASDATEGVLGVIPGEDDEVRVVEEQHDDHHWRRADHHRHCYGAGHGPRRVRAWVCSCRVLRRPAGAPVRHWPCQNILPGYS